MDSTDGALLRLANNILAKIPGSARVNKVSEINAKLFVSLYEGLFAESLPDAISEPDTAAHAAHNVQSVIDTLSLDILNTSLSHLSGDAIVAGDKAAIRSLLEVFEWLFEYILERIGSEASSEVGEGEETRDLDDPDLVTPEVIDSILQRELGRSYDKSSKVTFANGTKSDSRQSINSTSELIALAGTSRDQSLASPEKTADLIALGDSRYLKKTPPTRGPTNHIQAQTLDPKSLNSNFGSLNYNDTEKRLTKTYPSVSAPFESWGATGSRYGVGSRLSAGKESMSSLSTGPMSPDTINGRNGTLNETNDRGYNSTNDLIRESESIERRLGLASTLDSTTQPRSADTSASKTAGSVTLESSVSSSVSYPKPLSAREVRENTEFHDLGVRPLSSRQAYDSMGASMPVGHQYHNFTHHLYHHYNPVTNVLDPMSQSLPIDRKATKPQVNRDTQVTPGRFLGSASLASGDLKRDHLSKTAPTSGAGKSAATSGVGTSKSKSYSYDNLRHMLQQTMDMSKDALNTSPLRMDKKAASSVTLKDDPGDEELSRRLRETLHKLHQSETSRSDGTKRRQQNVQGILSPARKTHSRTKGRKVSFLTGRPADSRQPRSPARSPPRLGGYRDADATSPLKRMHTGRPSKTSPRATKTRKPSPKLYPRSPRSLSLSPTKRPGTAHQSAPLDSADLSTPSKRAEVLQELYNRMYKRRRGRSRTRSARHGSLTSNDDSYLSDGVVDYGEEQDGDSYRGDFQAELDAYKLDLLRRGQARCLDDVLDGSAPGRMGGIRRKLMKEDRRVRLRSEYLRDQYGQNLMDFEEEMEETMRKLKNASKDITKDYNKKIQKTPSRKTKVSGSVLWPKARATKNLVQSRGRKRSSTSSPTAGRVTAGDPVHDRDILPMLLEEFPFLHISSETLHNMWRRGTKQTASLTNVDAQLRSRKSKQQQEIEEAEWRQKLLADMAKKEVQHSKRMREIDERRKEQQAVKSSIRDKRVQHARVRKYYDEYSVRMRSKMLKKRTREELVFKKLFEDGLKIQQERIRELRGYAKQQREERSKKQRDQLLSIENYYRDRFSMLAESIETERVERGVKAKAQQHTINSMNRELRKKTESDIETIQEQIFRDEDEEYFRQLDADRLRHQLHLAKYKAYV